MTKSLSNLITLVLAGIGSILALLLTIEFYTGDKFSLPCSIQGAGCHGTLSSDYAHIGPIPTAIFGLGMYLIFVGLCWRRKQLLQQDRTEEQARVRAYSATEVDAADAEGATAKLSTPVKMQIRQLDLGVWLLALSGFCISWWLQYTSVWVIHSFCPYCFTSALLVSAIFGLASSDYLLNGSKLNGEQKMLGGVVSFVLLLLLFVYYPEIQRQVYAPPKGPVEQAPSVRDVVIQPNLHTQGDVKAPITVVEFADYMCPHCAEAAKEMPRILKEHPEMRLMYRSYPLGFPNTKFPFSDKASLAAEAAGNQGKFWEMHDLLFERQKETSDANFRPEMFDRYAQELGIDVKKFDTDMQAQETYQRVAKDHSDGDRANVISTPTFFFITKDKITSFTGVSELEKMLKKPHSSATR